MPLKNNDLHGSAPDSSPVALLMIDWISNFDFESGDELLKHAEHAAEKAAELKRKAKKAGAPVIYVNDNFGKWQSDFKNLLAHCRKKTSKGREIAKLLEPAKDDYFVLKPKHSAFYSTTLELLLEYLKAETLILTGLATDVCILFTANDAYMRDYNLIIPRDCVAAADTQKNENALEYIQRVLKTDISPSKEIDFNELRKKKSESRFEN